MPVFFPPEGRLGQAPVPTQPGPVDTLQAVVVKQPQLPELEEDAGLDPLLEAVLGGGTGAILGGIERLPLAAGAQDEEDGSGADPIGGAWPAAPEGMRVVVGGDAHRHEFPQLIGDAPGVRDGVQVHSSASYAITKATLEL